MHPPAELPPALGSRALFPTLTDRVCLNHAGVSPLPAPVAAAAAAFLAARSASGAPAFLGAVAQRERLRATIARLFGAAPGGVSLGFGTSRGLLDVAYSLDLAPADRVLGFAGEFPANLTPWRSACRAMGARFETLPLEGFGDGSGRGLARVEDALRRGGVRLIAVSAVQFQTGLAMPLAALAALAHAHGALLAVDAIQACGIRPLHAEALGIDWLVTGAHKWLMSLEGAGFTLASAAAQAAFVPRMVGWLSHTDPVRFLTDGEGHLRADPPLRPTVDTLEGGAANAAGHAALEASLGLLEALGVDAIYAHVQALHDAWEPLFAAEGFVSHRAPDPAARSGSLCFRVPPHLHGPALPAAFAQRGLSLALPDGQLRLAPHWPNGLHETADIAAILAEVVRDPAVAARPG
jgi:selenocysteine lyase/cysteine desulfurase